MNLEKLKNDWESLAKSDALHAILTDESKAGGKWQLEDFMATGEAEISTVMDHLRRIGHEPEYSGAALDFGCGVGRLTQALGRRFASCVGVDISQEMIDQAVRLNQYHHCQYLVNSSTALPFQDGTFTFIYSNIVLQHVPPRFAELYLREFVRILKPDGILVFGVQDSFAMPDLSSRVMRIRQTLRIRTRMKRLLGSSAGEMLMHCLPEGTVRRALGPKVRVVDIRCTNTAAKDFNGKLEYLDQPPLSGFVSRQYCALKES
jgi:2-polyprenyl-3-methyl-5-hydroxy-6-metoxy-1,4-benzoquinol methylase